MEDTNQQPADQVALSVPPDLEGLAKKNEQLLAEAKKAKEEAKALKKMLEDKEMQAAAAQQDYKKMYEMTLSEKKAYEEKLASIQKEKEVMFKRAALKKELEKEGAVPEVMEFLIESTNIEELKYDPDHNVVLGTSDVVKRIRAKAPVVFGRSGPQVNHKAPEGQAAKIDIDTFKSMKLADQKDPAKLKALYESYGIAVKP